ncbi:MAG: hypothetical protein Q8O81_10415 [Giesbergeria sp.]|nr:hypothetical protein [Giesbergeria sp.]
MKVLPRPHATTAIRRRIVWICVLTLVLSLTSLAAVLWFQHSAFGSNSWDFQGATGAATVIPSFAGVVLAGWAIYFQIKTSSPSYKAAEQSWLDISELYHRALKVGALLKIVEVDEPNDVLEEPSDAYLAQEPMPFDDLRARVRSAKGFSTARCAKEFEVDRNPDSFRTFATIALGVFPVLESLQEKLVDEARVDLIQLEADIDIVGAIYDADADYHEIAIWISSAISVLRRIVDLIELLQLKGVLSVDAIEDALLNPGLSKTIQQWFEQEEAVAEWRRNRKPVVYSQRGGPD